MDAENVAVCRQFAMENLSHHQFLDTDAHKLKRRFNGLIERLSWCGQKRKADALRQLLSFLEEVAAQQQLRSDDCDNVLALLSFLASSPQKSAYDAISDDLKLLLAPKQAETETLKHILNEEPFSGDHWQTDNTTVSSDDDGAKDDDDISTDLENDKTLNFDDWHPHLDLKRYEIEAKRVAEKWMKELDRTQYWRRNRNFCPPSEVTFDALIPSSLVPSLQKHIYDKTKLPGDHPNNQLYLHEAELVRELLFLLTGESSSAIFRLESDFYTVFINYFFFLISLDQKAIPVVACHRERRCEIAGSTLRYRL